MGSTEVNDRTSEKTFDCRTGIFSSLHTHPRPVSRLSPLTPVSSTPRTTFFAIVLVTVPQITDFIVGDMVQLVVNWC